MADDTIGMIGSGPLQGPKRVTRTGLALVHENEIVYPAAGNTAEAIQAVTEAKGAVQVFFPVQIEIRTASPDRDRSQKPQSSGLDGHATAQAIAPD